MNAVRFSSLVAVKEFRAKSWLYDLELKGQLLCFPLLVMFQSGSFVKLWSKKNYEV